MPVQLGKEKVYKVECSACGISETMVFRKSGFGYRHMPTASFDTDGKELKNVLEPGGGITGDSPPVKCPRCGGKLDVNEHQIRH